MRERVLEGVHAVEVDLEGEVDQIKAHDVVTPRAPSQIPNMPTRER